MPQISSSCGFEHALWILRSGDIRFHSAEKFKNILHFQGKKNKYGLHYKALHQICAYAHTHTTASMKLNAVGAPLRTNGT